MPTVDEYGLPVKVGAGDPAREAVNHLTRRGYRLIVLPRARYCGIMKDYEPPADPILAARLADCLEVIK